MGVTEGVVITVLAVGVTIPSVSAAKVSIGVVIPSEARNLLSAASATQAQPTSQDPSKKSGQTHHVRVAEEEAPSPELTKAEALIQKQNFADAEPLLKKVLENEPQNYVAWFDLGFVENALGRRDDSIAAYRKSVAAKPDVFESNLNLGLQLAKAGSPEAEQFLRAATKLTPTSHAAEGKERAWLSLAHVLQSTEDALAAYAEAAKLQPNDPEPHLSRGSLFERQNKFADAEQEYKEALALDPASSVATTGLANVYFHARRFPDAEAMLRKSLAKQPEQANLHIYLGRVLAEEEKNDAAIEELQTATKLAPNDTSFQRDLADLYDRAGKSAQAEPLFRTLVATHPDDAELRQALGQSLLRQKKFPEAQQEFLAAVKLKPDLGTAYGDLAFAASENKDFGLTIKALDARAKLLPEIPITYFLRASAYDNLKDVKRAAANYHLFLQASNGKYPDQEWQAKHRLIALEPKK